MRTGKARLAGTTREQIDAAHWKAMGKAKGLYDYLVDKQTEPAGWVNYKRPLTYAKIRKEVLRHIIGKDGEPDIADIPERTLRRWMGKLRSEGFVTVLPLKYQGMVVRIVGSKKWSQQQELFGQPDRTPIECRIQDSPRPHFDANIQDSPRPQMAALGGQKWPPKHVLPRNSNETSKRSATQKATAQALNRPSPFAAQFGADDCVETPSLKAAGPGVVAAKPASLKAAGEDSLKAAGELVFVGQRLKVAGRVDHVLGEAFPWVERGAEYRKIESWLELNPKRRPKRMGPFLQNWFNRILPPKRSSDGPRNRAISETFAKLGIARSHP